MEVKFEAGNLTEKPLGCASSLKHIAFVAAIVASFKGDFGQGRVGANNTGVSRKTTNLSWPSYPFFDLGLLGNGLPCAS